MKTLREIFRVKEAQRRKQEIMRFDQRLALFCAQWPTLNALAFGLSCAVMLALIAFLAGRAMP